MVTAAATVDCMTPRGGGLLLFDRRVIDSVVFKLTGEAFIHSGVVLGVYNCSRVRETIKEVGCQPPPPHA